MVRLLIIIQWIVERIPVGFGNWLADRAGDLGWAVAGRSRCAARSNMRHVLGPSVSERQVGRATRRVFRYTARNYFDLLRVEHLTDAQLDQMVDFDRESLAVVQQLAAEGKGLLFITAHWGAFDIVTQVLARRNLPMLLLVARFKPPSVAEFLIRLRGQRGMETVLVDDGLAALKRAMQALRNGRLVGMMPDRNIDRTGVMIPFFGDDTVMGTGLAKMALRGQTAVVPGFCRRITRNRYSVYFTPPIYPPREGAEADRVAALTKAVFAVIEQQIARAPEQWTLLQPVWPDAPCPPDPGLAPA